MVYHKYSLGLSNVEIAKRLNVDTSTVSRTIHLFKQTDIICNIQGYHEYACKKLSAYDELVIIEAVLNQPSLFLQKQEFTRKKLTFRTQQRTSTKVSYRYVDL